MTAWKRRRRGPNVKQREKHVKEVVATVEEVMRLFEQTRILDYTTEPFCPFTEDGTCIGGCLNVRDRACITGN